MIATAPPGVPFRTYISQVRPIIGGVPVRDIRQRFRQRPRPITIAPTVMVRPTVLPQVAPIIGGVPIADVRLRLRQQAVIGGVPIEDILQRRSPTFGLAALLR